MNLLTSYTLSLKTLINRVVIYRQKDIQIKNYERNIGMNKYIDVNFYLKLQKQGLELAFYPLLLISLSASFLFYKYLLQVYPSIMIVDLMGAFKIGGTELGFLSAFFFYAYVIMQIFSGVLIDNFSVRNLTSGAIFVSALGLLIFSQTDSFFVANLARIIMGCGAAFATVSYLKMASLLFPARRFPLLAGVMASAAMLGAMCGGAPLSLAVLQLGWRTTLIYSSLLGICLSCAVWTFFQRNNIEARESFFQINSIFSGLGNVIKNRKNWLVSLYCGFAFTPLNILVSLWGVPFIAEAYNLSPTGAAKEISFVLIGFMVGAPLIGQLSTYFSRPYNLLIFLNLFSGVSLFFIVFFSGSLNIYWLRVLFCIFGFSTSSFMVGFSIVKELNHPALIATAIAFLNSFEALLSGISEPLVGFILDCCCRGQVFNSRGVFSVYNYQISFSILLVYLVFSLTMLMYLKKLDKIEVKNVL